MYYFQLISRLLYQDRTGHHEQPINFCENILNVENQKSQYSTVSCSIIYHIIPRYQLAWQNVTVVHDNAKSCKNYGNFFILFIVFIMWIIIHNQLETRKLPLNWHNSSAVQSCTNRIQKYTMIIRFWIQFPLHLCQTLLKISLPDRSIVVPQDFLCSYCFGPNRLTADQEKGLPILLLLQ